MNTIEERRQENADKIKEKNKEYYQKNADKRKEYFCKYREEHREELRQKAKEHYAENIDKRKEYWEKNKNEMNEIRSEKILCECGAEHTRNGKAKHLRTAKHLNNLKKLADEADKKEQMKINEEIKSRKFKLYDEMMRKKQEVQ